MQFVVKNISKKFIKDEIKNIGFDPVHAEKGLLNHQFLSLKIFDINSPATNILKQTAISVGSECATNRHVIDCKVEKSDCILSGSISELKKVSEKLKKQPFSLAELSSEIEKQISLFESKKCATPTIMGILNLTTDSFSDGGEFSDTESAINHATDMIKEGAKIIDIGAQSSNANSINLLDNLSSEFKIEKIAPVLTFLKKNYPEVLVSIDTYCPETAVFTLQNGADIINCPFENKEIANKTENKIEDEIVKNIMKYDKKIVVMHNRGVNSAKNTNCDYENLIDDIYKNLFKRTQSLINKGVKAENIIIDVGFGFAKNIEQNFELLSRISEFKSLGYPILAGVSRKRFLQSVLPDVVKTPKDADFETNLATFYLAQSFDNIDFIRVHNVKEATRTLEFAQKL